MSIDRESLRLIALMRSQLQRIVDAHTREQTAAWVTAWDEVAPELEAALNEVVLGAIDGRVRRNDLVRSQRLLNALDVIQARLGGLTDASGQSIAGQLRDVVDYAGATQAAIVASQLPVTERATVAAWSKVSDDAISAIVTRTTEQITKTSYPIADDATAAIKRNLIRGVAVGENPRGVAAKMVQQAEGKFNGGLTRALTIARTEMLDAHRAASALSDQANADVLVGWVWTSALGTRTCSACWGMHGREFPLTVPGPEGHQNCRCTRVPKTKSWADLGFNIDEPSSLMPSAEDAFAALSVADQRSILGPKRYDAWTAGDYPMDAWAVKRTNPGWRDSYVISAA